jgi:Tfp pilus assembly protein PilF
MAVAYARAGAVEDAQRELEAALRRDPRREDVRSLLRSLPPPSP